MIRLTILGTLDLRSADGAAATALLVQPKRLALLAYLCVAPGDYHRRDTLLGLFWPDADAEHARTSLRKALHLLRRGLGREAVMSRGDDELGVDRRAMWCDVTAFRAAIDAGRLEDALALYGGDLLPGFFISGAAEFERWLEGERARLRQAAARAACQLADRHQAGGRLKAAVEWARRAVALSEPDERLVRGLIELLDRSGDLLGAIAAYDAFVRTLASDYDLQPSAETKALVERIRREARTASPARERDQARTDAPPALPRRARPVLFAVLILALGVAHREEVPRAVPRIGNPVIAVLPFAYTSRISGDRYFADGLQQEIISRLGTLNEVTVVDRRSASRYDAGDVRADFVLRTELLRDSAVIRLRTTLVETRTGETIWAQGYERDPTAAQLMAIQTDVARNVADALQIKMGSIDRGRGGGRRTESDLAYRLFLRASQLSAGATVGLNRSDAADNVAAGELLHEAIAADPGFAAAIAELANVYWARSYVFGDSGTWTDSAIGLAERAIALDPALASAYRPLGRSYLDKGQLDEAERTYHKILEVNPNDGDALLVLGWLALLRGRIPDAKRLWLDARAVDPLNVLVHFDLGLIDLLFHDHASAEAWHDVARAVRGDPGPQVGRLLREGKTGEALAAAERFLAAHPRSFTALQDAAQAAIAAGEYEGARRHLEEMKRRGPADWDYFGLTYRCSLIHVLLKLGELERAHALLAHTLEDAQHRIAMGDQRPGVKREIAAMYGAQGDTAEAYAWLRRAIDAGWRLEALYPSPLLDPLRGVPRFRELFSHIESDLRHAQLVVTRETVKPVVSR